MYTIGMIWIYCQRYSLYIVSKLLICISVLNATYKVQILILPEGRLAKYFKNCVIDIINF
jgi:hypothetical protein